MKVAFIARSSLHTSKGGDTIQILQTARHLEQLNIKVDIRLTDEKINYKQYDLLHFFNLIRPSDIVPHIKRTKIPFVVTPLLIDYSEYDRLYRKGISGQIFRHLSEDQIEYLKTILRWVKGQQKIKSLSYLFNGQRKSVNTIIQKAAMFLPNSEMEYQQLVQSYSSTPSYSIIPNGVDEGLFTLPVNKQKTKNMVLCVARIEGLKNQFNLILALNNSKFQLFIIGNAAINQMDYYMRCKKIAAANVHFIDHLPQEELINYYRDAKVHVLPSWFETCGLATLEAAAMGCNVVITNRGYASEYCNGYAFYCDPSSPSSILEAIDRASKDDNHTIFQKKIFADYTWQNAAYKTYEAYKTILEK
ncbi:MAG TPA: glycosyltransferase family 4 protein [Hanamia sp.]|nr:glycosyltransferase family 4 protein [Hanamia sp.]